MFLKLLSSLAVVAAALTATSQLNAAILFESGTLGPTGIPRNEVSGGSNVSPNVFVGVRFHLDQPVLTSQVGGHFVRNTGANESFFGAIVVLTDENDFPDSGNLSTSDVVGTTLLSFPEPSNEVFGNLVKPLSPGWYALVFGSGLFAATGSGGALNNGMDIGNPTYIAYQPLSGSGWGNLLNPIFRNFRFVVTGEIIPEPATLVSIVFLSCSLLGRISTEHKWPNTLLCRNPGRPYSQYGLWPCACLSAGVAIRTVAGTREPRSGLHLVPALDGESST